MLGSGNYKFVEEEYKRKCKEKIEVTWRGKLMMMRMMMIVGKM